MNNEDFKIDLKNDPRIMLILFLVIKVVASLKVYLHYVALEKMKMMKSCVRPGAYKQLKCFMIIRKTI